MLVPTIYFPCCISPLLGLANHPFVNFKQMNVDAFTVDNFGIRKRIHKGRVEEEGWKSRSLQKQISLSPIQEESEPFHLRECVCVGVKHHRGSHHA